MHRVYTLLFIVTLGRRGHAPIRDSGAEWTLEHVLHSMLLGHVLFKNGPSLAGISALSTTMFAQIVISVEGGGSSLHRLLTSSLGSLIFLLPPQKTRDQVLILHPLPDKLILRHQAVLVLVQS